MELSNEFKVDSPIDKVWDVLTDVERIAPCMPGARLEEADGDEFRGVVKVKVGPISAEYRGSASFLERDAAAYRAVLRAEGRETRGQGKASATITATLTPDGPSTAVTVTTDLAITGKVAQFGRGVLADVSAKLLGEFVRSLETTVLAGDAAVSEAGNGAGPVEGAAPRSTGASSATTTPVQTPAAGQSAGRSAGSSAGPSVAPAADPAAINLLQVVGPVLLKRLLPPAAGLLVLWLVVRRVRRRGGARRDRSVA
ncbi:MAG TPA: SRPBCC family protein [Acidimicrobiales bacterium]|nr:SRPBCC family protein [Acidimicrobiales bacterium]